MSRVVISARLRTPRLVAMSHRSRMSSISSPVGGVAGYFFFQFGGFLPAL